MSMGEKYLQWTMLYADDYATLLQHKTTKQYLVVSTDGETEFGPPLPGTDAGHEAAKLRFHAAAEEVRRCRNRAEAR